MMNKDAMMTAGLSLVHRPLQPLTWMEGFICRLQPSIPEQLGCLTSISPPQPLLICLFADYVCSLEATRAVGRGRCRPGQLSAQCVNFSGCPVHLHLPPPAGLPTRRYQCAFPTILSTAVAFRCCRSSCRLHGN